MTLAALALLTLFACDDSKPGDDTGSVDSALTDDTGVASDDTGEPPTDDTGIAPTDDTAAPDTDTGETGLDTDSGDVTGPVDEDGDGATSDVDCDDTDPLIRPGAVELCDGVRNDCDDAGWTDDGGLASFRGVDGVWADWTAALTGGVGAVAGVTVPDGDLHLCANTWFATLRIDGAASEVNILGVDGPDLVVLEADASGPVIDAEGDGLTLTVAGLTLAGGAGAATDINGSTAAAGGGLRCVGESTIVSDDVRLEDNAATYGGGALLAAGCALSGQLNATGNSAERGGGIYVLGGALDLSGGYLGGNTATFLGGALGVSRGDGVTLTDCAFAGNEALGTNTVGGALYVAEGTVDILGGTFEENSASYGGFAFVEGDGVVRADSAVFDNNSASESGGGFYFETGAAHFDDVTLSNNSARGDGGGLFLTEAAATLNGGAISGNTAGGGGGGLVARSDGSADLTTVSLSGNDARDGGGAARVEDGGAMYFDTCGFLSNTPDDIQTREGGAESSSVDGLGTSASGQCFDSGCDYG